MRYLMVILVLLVCGCSRTPDCRDGLNHQYGKWIKPNSISNNKHMCLTCGWVESKMLDSGCINGSKHKHKYSNWSDNIYSEYNIRYCEVCGWADVRGQIGL